MRKPYLHLAVVQEHILLCAVEPPCVLFRPTRGEGYVGEAPLEEMPLVGAVLSMVPSLWTLLVLRSLKWVSVSGISRLDT